MSDKSYVGMSLCFYCLKNPVAVLLDRRLKDTLNREQVVDMEPCDECKALMEQGVILIAATPASLAEINSDKDLHERQCDQRRLYDNRRPPFIPNPHRTGQWLVVSEDWVKRVLPTELANWALKYRWMFVEEEVAQNLLEAHEQLQADQEVEEEAAANES